MKRYLTKSAALIIVGAMLLAAGGSAVMLLSKDSKKRIEKELDEKLYSRIRNEEAVGDYMSDLLMELVGRDDDMDEYYNLGSSLLADTVSRMVGSNQSEYPSPSVKRVYSGYDDIEVTEDLSISLKDAEGAGMPVMVITDTNGDRYYVWEDTMNAYLEGYFYYEVTMNFGDSYSSDLQGMNDMSLSDSNMKEAVKEILKEDKTGGWYEEYRYTTWTHAMVAISDDPLVGYTYVDVFPYETEDSHYDYDLSEARYKFTYILFEDGAVQMKEWREETTRNAVIAFSAWVVCMVVLAVLMHFTGANKADTEEKTEADGGTASFSNIPVELGKELLLQVDQTESCMGPNSYLDQMRELIKDNMSDVSNQEKE